FDGDRLTGDCTAAVLHGRRLGAGGYLDHHIHLPGVGDAGAVDLHARDLGRADTAGRVVIAAVQELHALERRALGDAVDGVQDGVHLELVGLNFFRAQTAGVGRLVHQALQLGQQRADFVQTTLGGAD